LVTGQTQSIAREGVPRSFGYWIDTVDRQRGGSEMLGDWFDTVGRQSGGTEMFGHWLDTQIVREGVLRRLVTG